MQREPYLPSRKSVSERIKDLRKQREEIDERIRSLEALEHEALKEGGMQATYETPKKNPWDRSVPYWMKSGRHG